MKYDGSKLPQEKFVNILSNKKKPLVKAFSNSYPSLVLHNFHCFKQEEVL